MSIFILGAEGATDFARLALPIAAVVALGMCAVGGVFNPRRIAGPERLASGESPRVLLEVIGYAVVAWACANFALGVYLQYLGHHRPHPTPAPMTDSQQVLFGCVVNAAAFVAMLAATAGLRRQGIKSVGLNPAKFPGGVICGIVGIIMVFPLVIYLNEAVELILHWLRRSYPPHPMLLIFEDHSSGWLRVTVIFLVGVLVPLAEEMLFRGQVQTFLRYWLKRRWPAVFLAAALFALLHPPASWPAIFFLGICLGYAYERTGNLWICIVVHALFNLGSVSLFWFQMGHR